MNKYGKNRPEDEREFARLAASKANVQLLEIPLFASEQLIDDSFTQLPLTAKPTVSGTIGLIEMSLLKELCGRVNASSLWTGQGGDHLFMQTSLPLGAVDYAALRGFGPGLMKSYRDAVHISKWNYWRIARLVLNKDFDSTELALGQLPIAKQPFITAEVRSRIFPKMLLHPWIMDAASLPPGQRVQIASLCEVLNRHRPIPGLEAAQELHPLLSQPLLELCLRIPSYIHHRGGVDRAVERAAVADLVPNEIISRRAKGQSTFSTLNVIQRSNGYIRDLVLDGMLVKEGILDRNSLEPILTDQRPLEVFCIWPLLSSIAAEIWVRNWHHSLGRGSQQERSRPAVVL